MFTERLRVKKADLEVRWPSGVEDKVPGVAANQVVKITEGKGMGAEVRVAAVIYCVPTFGLIFLASAISASCRCRELRPG